MGMLAIGVARIGSDKELLNAGAKDQSIFPVRRVVPRSACGDAGMLRPLSYMQIATYIRCTVLGRCQFELLASYLPLYDDNSVPITLRPCIKL